MKVNKPIEWIKNMVKGCMSEFETEDEKKEYFVKLEEIYRLFTDQEKADIRHTMKTQFEVNDMIYVFSILVQYMDSEDFQEDLAGYILKGDFDCYTGSMLQFQMARYVRGEYRAKRILYKKNLTNFEKMIEVENDYVSVNKRNKKRITIITGQLLWASHAPTRKILSIAYVLQKYLGFQLQFFVCPCNAELPHGLWFNQVLENFNVKYLNGLMKIAYRDEEFQGYQIGMGTLSYKEYSMMLQLIYLWNPFFVIDMNTTNPVAGLIGKFTTLVSMPMSMECPVSEGEILLRVGRKDDASEKLYRVMLEKHQTQIYLKEKMPVIPEMNYKKCERKEVGLPENKFLIVIVGYRLNLEIDVEFVQVMRKILEKKSNIAFVFIGNGDELKRLFEDEIFTDSVYYLGECENLMGIYENLDLYLNPRRQGGGHSSAMALLAGIPVVTLPNCDVAHNCGEGFIVQDYEGMIETVCKYIDDERFRKEKVECIKRYKDENGEEQLIRHVKEIVESVTNVFTQC